MVPSSLKKMSGSRARKEGNHASLDLSSSGTSLNIDLGLTLLHGSQTQKEGEDKLDHVANTRCESFSSKSPGVTQDAFPSKIAKQQVNGRSGSQYGNFYPSSQELRKLDRRMSTQWLDHSCSEHLTGAIAIKARGESANTAGLLGREQRQEDNALSVRLNRSLENGEAWKAPAEESSSGSASVLESKTLMIKIPDTLARSVKPNVNEVRLHDRGFLISTVVDSKQIAEPELWKDSIFSVQDRSRTEIDSNGFSPGLWHSPIKSNTNVHNGASKLTKFVNRSWTSRFPGASKGTNTRSHARAAVTSPPSIAFTSPQKARLVSEFSTGFQNPKNRRIRQKNFQAVTKNGYLVGALSLEGSLSIAPNQSQQHSSRKRTNSLPNLPSTRHASSMDSPNKYQSSGLPTPPLDQRVNGSYHPASSQLSSRAATSYNMIPVADHVSKIPNPIATKNVHPIRSGLAEGDQYPMVQSSYSSAYSTALSISNFQRESVAPYSDRPYSTDQVFPNNETMLSTLQQSQHQDVPQETHKYQLNSAEVEASLDQSQGRWPSSFNNATETASSRWKSECDQLKTNYSALQKEIEILWQQVRFLEADNLGLLQRLHAVESNLTSRDQLVANLQDRLTRVQSELEAKAARPRPDAVIANSILQRLPPKFARDAPTRVNALEYSHAEPKNAAISAVAPGQLSPSQQSVTDTTTDFQTQIRPVGLFGQMMTLTAIPSNGRIEPTKATSSNDHLTSPLSTHFSGPRSFLGPMGSTAHTRSDSMPNKDESSIISNVPLERVTIDLIDESSPPSLSDSHPKLTSPASGPPAESDQEGLQGSGNRSNDEKYSWLKRSDQVVDVRMLFGPPSMGFSRVETNVSEQLPALRTSAVQPKKVTKRRARKAREESRAGAELDEAQTERLQTEQKDKRKEGKAASNKKYRERQKQLGEQLGQRSDTSTSRTRQPQKETRKLAKVQERQEQAQRPLAETQRQVAQYTLDGKAYEKPSSHLEFSTEQNVDQSTRIDTTSLIGDNDNMDWSQELVIEDPIPPTISGEGLNEEDYGAMLEATMAAQAEIESMANVGHSNAGATKGDALGATINAIASTGPEGSGCLNDFEREENEEGEDSEESEEE